ncbi:vesicle transport through interaction with t-SNAREs homolog 1A isoform X1 [Tyto alba]|uniref:vesicle transport through interaction with t-SNAREs homolog 1A isoform X1 n=1 Tax=Tyto alba TaxID=56313 RepID=UPI001C67AD36|nr:vesicle transport through interaction with t-SNAREs homolog 1A isoform X1 [Tyto alba]
MSSDFESYEQDFAVLTADITGKIGKVPKLLGDEKKQMVANVEKQLEEARELLEQMELEVREIPPQSRGMYSSRMRSYKQEMGKLEADFKRSRIAYSDEVRNELLGDDGNSSENQLIKLREERAHLLDNTERLERSSRRLEAGYQIAVETEQIGQEMLENLSHDREKIQRARERLRETDANLGKSSRILTGMLRSFAAGECACRKLPGLQGCSRFPHPLGARGRREPQRSKRVLIYLSELVEETSPLLQTSLCI